MSHVLPGQQCASKLCCGKRDADPDFSVYVELLYARCGGSEVAPKKKSAAFKNPTVSRMGLRSV